MYTIYITKNGEQSAGPPEVEHQASHPSFHGYPLLAFACFASQEFEEDDFARLDLLYSSVVKDDWRIEHAWFSNGDSLCCQVLAMHVPVI